MSEIGPFDGDPFSEFQDKAEAAFLESLKKAMLLPDWDDIEPLYNAFLAEVKRLNSEGHRSVWMSSDVDGEALVYTALHTGHCEYEDLPCIPLSAVLLEDDSGSGSYDTEHVLACVAAVERSLAIVREKLEGGRQCSS